MEISVDAVAFRKVAQPPHSTVYVEITTVDGEMATTDAGRVEPVPTLGHTFAIRQRLSLPGPREQPDRPVILRTKLRCGQSKAVLLEVDVAVSKQWTVALPPATGEVYVSYYCSFGEGLPPRPLRPASAIAARRGTLSRLPAATSGGHRPASAGSLPPQPSRTSSASRRNKAGQGDVTSKSTVPEMTSGRRVALTINRVDGLSMESKLPQVMRVCVNFARRIRRTPTVVSVPTGLVHAVDFGDHCVSFFVPSFNLTPHVQVSLEAVPQDTAAVETVASIKLPLHAGDGMQPVVGHPGSLLRYTMVLQHAWEEVDTDEGPQTIHSRNTADDASKQLPVTALIPHSLRMAATPYSTPAALLAAPRSAVQNGALQTADGRAMQWSVDAPELPGAAVYINGVNISELLSSTIRTCVQAAATRIDGAVAGLERRVATLEAENRNGVKGAASIGSSSSSHARRWPSFEELDIDGRGYISTATLRRVLRSCDPFALELSDVQLDQEILAAMPAEAVQRNLVSHTDYHALVIRMTKR